MSNQLSRRLVSFALAVSMLASSLVAATAAPQQQRQPTTAPQTENKDSKDKKKDEKAAPTNNAPTQNVSNKPLSTDEDPAMIGKRNLNKGLIAKMSMSIDKEIAQGRQLAAEVDREAKFIDDPVITEYVNRVAQNLILHSDAKIPFTVKVIDSDEVNAFALPGGFFYVNKGLILAADNEAELAGVMGHEISHVIARHYAESQTKGMMAEIGLIASSIFLGGLPGMAIYNAEQFGLLATFMKFSRSNEAEADKLGVQYLYAAGYDPNAMSTMFEKLEAQNKKKPGKIAKTFATHPQSIDRLNASRALVARFPAREEYVINTSEFQRVKARLLRLSNTKITSVGDLASGDDGQPKRPTLKRRSPSADDTSTNTSDSTTTTTDTQQKPADQQKTTEPPKLRRRSGDPNPATQPPPEQ